MTEKSYFYDGTTVGDAALAPYNAERFAELRSVFMANHKDAVLTAVNTITVTPSGGMTILVGTGNVLLQGFFYRHSGTTLTVPSNTSSLSRIDRAIMRVNWPTKEFTTVLKMGQPAAVPQPPELTQEVGGVYEVSLARIYVPDGLAAVTAPYIIDERQIISSPTTTHNYSNENIMPNSEFIASAGTNDHASGAGPAMWTQTANVTCTKAEKFPTMRRGSTINVSIAGTGTTIGLLQKTQLSNGTSVPFTLRFLIEVSEGLVWVDLAGGTGAGTAWIPVTNRPTEVIIRSTTTTNLNLFIGKNSATTLTTAFRLGQITLAYGDMVASEQATRETILFGRPLVDLALGAIPGSYVKPSLKLGAGFRELLARGTYRDSNSSGGAVSYLALGSPLGFYVEVGRLPNNSLRALQGFVSPLRTAVGEVFSYDLVHAVQAVGTGNAEIVYVGCTT
jgi:hypothetical protein